MNARTVRLVAAFAGIALAAAACAVAQDGIRRVERTTGTDAESLARRVQALEERLDSLWSLRSGPDLMSVDTVDRMATRLLAAEARLAALEGGGAGGSQVLHVVTSASVLSAADFPALVRAARDGNVLELRHLLLLVRHTPWPDEIRPSAAAVADSLTLLMKALARGEPGEAERLARGLDQPRKRLGMAAFTWAIHSKPPQATAHMDHSARHGGQLGMRGDLHVELAWDTAGTARVHLSGPTREPLRTDGVTGELVLQPDQPGQRRIPLESRGDHLAAGVPVPAAGESVDVRVRLEGTIMGEVEMDFRIAAKVK